MPQCQRKRILLPHQQATSAPVAEAEHKRRISFSNQQSARWTAVGAISSTQGAGAYCDKVCSRRGWTPGSRENTSASTLTSHRRQTAKKPGVGLHQPPGHLLATVSLEWWP